MKKRKKQIKLKQILSVFLFIVLMLMLMAGYSIFKKINNNNIEENIITPDVNVIVNYETIKESADEDELVKLQSMSERGRIEYYIAKFIKNVEEKKYQEAYKVLNNNYKKRYFPTIQDFIEYTKNKFTIMADVEYTNFERNGQIYVSWLTITDAINKDKNLGEEMNFVVKENSFNDYELSFSIK